MMMKELGHGQGYRYAHDEPDGIALGERYFPEALDELCVVINSVRLAGRIWITTMRVPINKSPLFHPKRRLSGECTKL